MARHSEILKQVFLHMQGLVVVDHQSRIVFVEPNYARVCGFDARQVVGRQVKEVIPSSKLPTVVKTGRPILGDVFSYENKTVVCNRYPLFKDGVLIGAMSYAVFDGVDKLFESITELRNQVEYYKEKAKKQAGARYSLAHIIGASFAADAVRTAILQAANTNSTVLIQGETGTGKELVAHALHQESRRGLYPFVKVNCAAIPQELIESELFGYEEGAFTGARKTGKKGKFEQAHKGTLFLDEISQLPLAAQSKLLRVLQEKEVERVGGAEAIPVDVRIIAATNDQLEDMVKRGAFRADLYYRLNVLPIKVPPLRERKADIPLLVGLFMKKFGDLAGLGEVDIAPEAMSLLGEYDWPGNIRELEHAVERAINLCSTNTLEVKQFDWLLPKLRTENQWSRGQTIKDAVASSEKEVILAALRTTQGNKKKAAELLDIARPLLYQKMRRLGML